MQQCMAEYTVKRNRREAEALTHEKMQVVAQDTNPMGRTVSYSGRFARLAIP